MKLKLTPELSYLIGFWSKLRSKEGLGIEAGKDAQEIFAQQLLEQKLTETDKLLSDADKLYFYHGKYRKFFQEIDDQKLERYKYINEYSANYLAGMFDAVGGINDRGFVYLARGGGADEMLLSRLGFPSHKSANGISIGRPKAFLLLIKNYTKRFANHPVMEMLKKKKKGE